MAWYLVNPANRAMLATNIASFVAQHGLDGADIDWEYPAAPDLPYIPPADPIDGPNYLAFLKLLRAALPSGKSLSIAAPASYWYLRGFPIKDIGSVVDYIVYMTYDLHGQWDADSEWSQDGCHNGKCLRSHVNMTETHNALVMITKAGVPANKVIVGVTSYGRAFKMKDLNCRGAMCEYTGTANVSEALPGPCTGTRGYIANAEINEFIAVAALAKRDGLDKRAAPAVESYYDPVTRSNIAILNGTWVAYMDATEKAARALLYKGLNLGGTSDWAHDLESFTAVERKAGGSALTNKFTNKGLSDGGSTSTTYWYDLSCGMDEVTSADMDRKQKWTAVMADDAWAAAVQAYATRARDTGSFSSWIIGKFFLGPQGVNCGTTLGATQCLVQQNECHDKKSNPPDLTVVPPERTGPAGMFIANSFVYLESAFVNYYDAIRGARADVSGLLSVLEDYFMKEEDPTFGKQLGWNILAVLTASVSGPLFGNLFRYPGLENVANAGLQGIIATAKDKQTGNIEDELSKASTLALAMNATMNSWEKAITGFSAKVFSGTDGGNALLKDFMTDGALIPGGVPRGSPTPELLTADEMKDLAKRALFMHIIPTAWKNNKDANVAILDTKRACGDFSTYTGQHVPVDVAKKVEFCLDGKNQYLFLAAVGVFQHCTQSPGAPVPYCEHSEWSAPPGIEKLPQFGIEYKDLMNASLTTWTKNGGKNGAVFNPDTTEIRSFFDPADPDTDKLVTLGMVTIPVCKLSEANVNWGPSSGGDFYPC